MSQGNNGVPTPQPSDGKRREVAVIRTGYVGLTSAVCLADLGHRVVGFDIDARKVDALQQAVSPIFEDGLDGLLAMHRQTNRLSFTTRLSEATKRADFVFICVATPSYEDGALDLSQVNAAAPLESGFGTP
jgi:UDPglucose 6-dehydrogenase